MIEDTRLLVLGWGGLLGLDEARYIAEKLAHDANLRRQWGFRQQKRYPLQVIAARAFPENPAAARQYIESQQRTAKAEANNGCRKAGARPAVA